MSTKPLEIKNYLSEELKLLSELLNKVGDTLLVSPTDSGKTRAIINLTDDNRFNIKYLQRAKSKAII